MRSSGVTLGLALVSCWATPSDSAELRSLSREEKVGLCDELRDAVDAVDAPIECDGGQTRFVVPSRQACRDADLSECRGTAGDVRACYEAVRADRCGAVHGAPAECQPIYGCAHEILAGAEIDGTLDVCPRASARRLQAFDGVYAVSPYVDVQSQEELETITAATSPPRPSCSTPAPALLDAGALWVVLVTTEASGSPLVVLRSCRDVVDCQTLAERIRDGRDIGTGQESEDALRQFYGCDYEPDEDRVWRLDAVASDTGGSCQPQERPLIGIASTGSDSILSVYRGTWFESRFSSGCGYAVTLSPREPLPCLEGAQYRLTWISAL